MPFVRVDKQLRSSVYAGAMPSVRMGAYTQNNSIKSVSIYFGISHEIVEQAGWEMIKPDNSKWRMSCHVAVHEGVGKDAGFLLLVADPKGYAFGTTSEKSKGVSANVTMAQLKHYKCMESTVPTHEVEYTVDEKDHSVLIQCPEWLRYNSLSYTEPVVEPVPLARPTQAAKKGGKLNATVSNVAMLVGEQLPEANRTERRDIARSLTQSLRS